MPRGGRRQGTPGTRYANRTDLQTGPRKLPVSTAPGQTYGEAGQQAQAQQAVPMSNGPLNTAPDPLQAAKEYNPPPVIPMNTPTLRPDEHVMTGVGQPAQPPLQATPVLKGAALLNALGDDASPAVKALRDVLNAQQANQGAP